MAWARDKIKVPLLKLDHKASGDKAIWEEGAEGLGADAEASGPPRGPFFFSCAYVNKIVSVKEFIEKMVKEAQQILEGLARQYKLG